MMFSIVIPTYNNADEIGDTITSILNQTYEKWQLIIVDDGSTDDTKRQIDPFLKYPNIKYVYQPNGGVTCARNKGIEHCCNKFITFLDADDTVTKNWLKDFNDLVERADDPGYLSGALIRNSKLVLPKLEPEISKSKYSSLAGSFAILAKVIRNIGGYDENLKQSENWEMTARALEYCENNHLEILHHENADLIYNNYPTAEQTLLRDRYRADAVLYLYHKYNHEGVFHYRKDEFLVSAAINYARIGSFKKARGLFLKSFIEKPSLATLSRILVCEIPPLRRKKWIRNNSGI